MTRKEEIIHIAATLFKERGFNAVSMRDIAEAMHMKAASLYNHIKGKQEILSIVILDVAKEFTRTMDEIVSQRIDPIEKIEKIIAIHIDIAVNNSEGIAALNNDWMHLENQDLKYFIRMRDRYEANFRSIIKQGIEEGQIQPKHPEVMLFSILSSLRTLYLWNEKRGKLEADTLKKELVSVLLKGII